MLQRANLRAMLLRMTTALDGDRKRIPADTLPLRLVMLRYEAHVSQREAAFRCGITPRVWQGMEEGRNTANLLDVLQVIADEFGYDQNWLAYGGELKKKNPRRPDGDGGGQESHLGESNSRPIHYKAPIDAEICRTIPGKGNVRPLRRPAPGTAPAAPIRPHRRAG